MLSMPGAGFGPVDHQVGGDERTARLFDLKVFGQVVFEAAANVLVEGVILSTSLFP